MENCKADANLMIGDMMVTMTDDGDDDDVFISMLETTQVPQPTFGSGLGLQCAYPVVISLSGLLVPKFGLKSPKMLQNWIAPCIRKPQAEFHKISTTHVSPSSH